MSTKESIHSARSGHSAHSNEESLLVDNQQSGNQKKKLVCAGIIMAVMLICMGVAIFFAIYQMKGLDDAKAQKDELIKKRDQMIKKNQDLLTNKVLTLNNLNLRDLTITIGKQGSSKIKGLHLGNNNIKQFNAFNLPNLQELTLDGNPLIHFNDNVFTSLKTISLPGTTIIDFDNNQIPHIQTLDISQHSNLVSFQNNKLDDVTSFAIAQSLVDFTGNYLPKTSAFNISSFTAIRKFFGNYINLDNLFVESQTLQQFYNNTFPTITQATINKSNLQYVFFQNCLNLQTLTIRNSPKLNTLRLSDLPKLKYLNLDTPALVKLEISNVNITEFPMKISDLRYSDISFSLIESLSIRSSPVKTCNLLTFNNLRMLDLQDLPLEDIEFLNKQDNIIQTIWFGNLYLQNFSYHQFPELTQLVLSNNLNLQEIKNNTMPNLKQLKIYGSSQLKDVGNNYFSNLEKVTMINSNDAKTLFEKISNKYITGLQLRNNSLRNNEIDFNSFPNLKYLAIYDNLITDLVLNNPTIEELHLDLEQLNSLQLLNTKIKGINQLGDLSFTLKTPLLKSLIIQKTPFEFFIKLSLPSLLSLTLNETLINDFSNNSFPNLINFTLVGAPVYVVNISYMTHLQRLHIQNSDIISLTQTVLPSVTHLTLLNNTYLDIFDSTFVPNLIDLSINSNLPTGLDTIILNNSKLSSFSYQLQYLINLVMINNPSLKNISNNHLPFLQTFHIQNAPLQNFQKNLFGNLKNIFFKDVPISFDVSLIGSAMQQIHLQNNNLQSFNINNYTNLKTFHCSKNPITSMNVTNLINLQNFQIDAQKIQTLIITNTSITNYKIISTNLSYLQIEDSPIRTFTDNIFQHLDNLKLINTNLSKFENNNLPDLQTLTIINSPYLQSIDLMTVYYIKQLTLENLPDLTSIVTDKSFKNLTSLIIKNIGYAQIDTSNFTSLQTLQLGGEFQKITIANSQLTSFSGMVLHDLVDFTLRNNYKLKQFKENTFTTAKRFEITNTDLTDSQNNNFPVLSQVIIKNSKGDISNLLNSFDHGNVLSLTLTQVQVPGSFQISTFTKLDSLVLQQLNMTILALSDLPLTFVRLTLPILQQLTLSNITVQDYSFNGLPVLKNLIINNCSQLPRFSNESLPQLTSISLTNNKIITVANNQFPKLQQFILQDSNTQSISLVAPELVSFEIQTPALKALTLDAPIKQITSSSNSNIVSISLSNVIFESYEINNFTSLVDLSIKSQTLNDLTITESPHLSTIKNSLLPNLTTLTVVKSNLKDLTNFNASILNKLYLKQSSAQSFILPVISNKLTDLTLDTVPIVSLNLASYPQLSNLYVNSQKLSQLNVQNNINLKTLQNVNLVPVVNLTIINTGISSIVSRYFTNLVHLYISGNKFINFQLNDTPKLQNLTFIDDNIVQLQIVFENILTSWNINCPALQALTIQGAPFKSISNIQTPNLQSLKLQKMPLTDPNPIQLLPKLVALGIDNCNISTINFANFPILNTLLLHECKELKTLVGQSSTLQFLQIFISPKLQNLPFQKLPNIKYLYLQTIPNIVQQSIANLNNLETLSFQDVNITDLSKLNIPNIKTISINGSDVSNLGECKWSNLQSVVFENVKLQKFQCQSPNLKLLTIYNTLSLTNIAFDSFQKLQQIDFERINITKFSGQTLPNLQKLKMNSVLNLENFTRNEFENLQTLDIYNAVKINSIESEFPKLTHFFLYNSILYNEIFNYASYPELIELAILNTSIYQAHFGPPIKTIIIGNHVQKCNLSTVTFAPGSSIKNFIGVYTRIGNISNEIMNDLEQLYLSWNQQLYQFKNNTIPNLKTLDLSNTLIQQFSNNNYQKLTKLYLSHSPISQFKQNNLTSLQLLYIKNATSLKTIEQSLPQVTTFDLQKNSLTEFPNIASLLPKIRTLNLDQSSFFTVTGQKSQTLYTLDISGVETGQQTFTFTQNEFDNLVNLDLSNSNVGSFSDNNLSKLQNLFLANNTNINQQQLMAQISVDKTPELKLLSIVNCGINESNINIIKQQYPSIIIINE